MDEKKLRDLAWTGDAVLALFAREWILLNTGKASTELFTSMTSNRFLSTVGVPTEVEARIGEIYATEGLGAAFAHVGETLVPIFLKQMKNKARREGSSFTQNGIQEPVRMPMADRGVGV